MAFAAEADASSTLPLQQDSKPALTPPTSEEWNQKLDGDTSDLSDLEPDDDDIGEIEPDHYYEGGRVPVFKPVRTYRISSQGLQTQVKILIY